ncbi:MAG TPA: alternative oxidase [Acidimicrobiia bacterium]|nr:alternative oxidase [Acidimicrobiia bacterium]
MESRELSSSELKKEQQKTLETPRMHYGISAWLLFRLMDVVYGRKAALSKFLVLEIIARMPYVAWEQVSYVAITHTHSAPKFARRIHGEVLDAREQQDNELWHLLIIEELTQTRGYKKHGLIRVRVLPQILAYLYYHLSWFLYVLKPRWSYLLNAQFEDHAEHEYMGYVRDHPETDDEKWESSFRDEYGNYETVGDLLRAIALDERHHKLKSLEQIEQARFHQFDDGDDDDNASK